MRSALILLWIALFPCLALAEATPVPHLPPDPDLVGREAPGERKPPPGWEIVNPAEFCPAEAMTIGWPGWGEDLLSSLVLPVALDDLVYVVVANTSMQAQADNYLSSYGLNMANVEFVTHSTLDGGGMWIRDYLGIDSLVIFTPMLDETGHCDMMAKLLSDTLFIVGEYENEEDGRPGDKQRLDDIAALFDGLQNLEGRDFEVVRMPMCPAYQYSGYWVNRTYTNSLIFNDKVLVPTYGEPTEAEALQIYAEHMPGHEILGIDSAFIIEWLGTIHCTTNCIHADDPLMVLHEPMESVYEGTQPFLRFSLNPRYGSMSASVWWKRDSQGSYTEAPAAFSQGVWTAALPATDENFSYYVTGSGPVGPDPLRRPPAPGRAGGGLPRAGHRSHGRGGGRARGPAPGRLAQSLQPPLHPVFQPGGGREREPGDLRRLRPSRGDAAGSRTPARRRAAGELEEPRH